MLMRSWASFSSPTAHITFCTFTELLRPQILIMDGLPARHRCASASLRHPARLAARADPRIKVPYIPSAKAGDLDPGACAYFVAHVLVGEPVPTSQEHAHALGRDDDGNGSRRLVSPACALPRAA